MIHRIGVIFQGPNDRGFLQGLRDRLGCKADIIGAKGRGKTQTTVRRLALMTWREFQSRGVDLVVRLTDAGPHQWQRVKQEEQESFPQEMRSLLVCGAMPGAVEAWLALDRVYLERSLGISASERIPENELVGRVKSSLRRLHGDLDWDEAVRLFVADAPHEVFQRWLQDPSLRDLYIQCRDAAIREGDCLVKDELRDSK